MIVDGQHSHDWQATTPLLKKHLEDSDVADGRRGDIASASVATCASFGRCSRVYNVVVLNYNGQEWSDDTKAPDFVRYVRGGGGSGGGACCRQRFPTLALVQPNHR